METLCVGKRTIKFLASRLTSQQSTQFVGLKMSGTIGNLDDPQTVRRHQAAIPELARIVKEFESDVDDKKDLHHEMYPQFQQNFRKDVRGLQITI